MRLRRALSTAGLTVLACIVLMVGALLAHSAVRASAAHRVLRLSAVTTLESAKPASFLGPIEEFYEALQKIEQYYYRPLTNEDRRHLTYAAIKGMVRALGDPYSRFMTPEESKDFRIEMSGQVQGIGAVLTERNGKVVVIAPLKGGPAQRAGLKPFDVILKVDGKPVKGLDLQKVVNMIRGKPGTKVTLTIWRAGRKEPFEVTIVRETVEIPAVEWEMKDKEIGYIKLVQFNEKTPSKLDEALSDLAAKGAKALILDLRGNPGGPLEGAIEVASRFLKEGVIVYIKGRRFKETREVIKDCPKCPIGPMVVLVDEGTASASEIVAAALKDHGRATIVGTPTFGKGLIQTVVNLSDGSSLAITSAKYFRPNGKPIDHDHPIKPDVEVKLTEEDEAKGRDPQLERAIEILKEKPGAKPAQ